jgi:endonuclease YncB( thermonuclease family)
MARPPVQAKTPPHPGYSCRAEVLEWIDGDTAVLAADVWPTLTETVHVRLDGLDTPEHGTPGAAEAAARDAALCPVGATLTLTARQHPEDKYGRILAQLTTLDGVSINGTLLAEHLAKDYHGGSKAGLWPAAPAAA